MADPYCREDYVKVSDEGGGTYTFCARCPMARLMAPHPTYPCDTEGCPGDGRYGAPGRGHREGCAHPLPRSDSPDTDRLQEER